MSCGGKDLPVIDGVSLPLFMDKSSFLDEQGEYIDIPSPKTNIDWPQFRGNENRSVQHVTINRGFNVQWKEVIGKKTRNMKFPLGEPVVSDGKIFFHDSRSIVYALSDEDGSVLWTYDAQSDDENNIVYGSGGIAYSKSILMVANAHGNLMALNADTGTLMWEYTFGAPVRSSPLIIQDKLVVLLSRDNNAYAFDMGTGRLLWISRSSVGKIGVLDNISPAYYEGTIVLPLASGELSAVDSVSGNPLWVEYADPSTGIMAVTFMAGEIISSPTITDSRVFVGTLPGTLTAIDLSLGNIIWHRKLETRNSVWVSGRMMFVTTVEGKLLCIDSYSGFTVWSTDLKVHEDDDAAVFHSPIVANYRVIVTSSTGMVLNYDVKTGALLDVVDTGETFSFSPVVANNAMYFVIENGSGIMKVK